MPYYPPPQSGTTFATPAKTTPGALSTAGAATTAIRSDAGIQSPGGVASRSTATGGITNTETQVVGVTIPANFCQVGTTFRIIAYCHLAFVAGTLCTFRVRMGTTTLTGNIATTLQGTSANTGGFKIDALVTVRTTGVAGSVIGGVTLMGDNAAGTFTAQPLNSDTTATVALDTTAAKILELTAITGGANTTLTFHLASIEVVVM